MIRHGSPPYLECSTRGDKRFSAFGARIVARDFRLIEDLYQSAKIFPKTMIGVDPDTGHMLEWRHAKGRTALNHDSLGEFYDQLWVEYMQENPELIQVLVRVSGLSDMYGQEGHVCQATSLWKIRNNHMTTGVIG